MAGGMGLGGSWPQPEQTPASVMGWLARLRDGFGPSMIERMNEHTNRSQAMMQKDGLAAAMRDPELLRSGPDIAGAFDMTGGFGGITKAVGGALDMSQAARMARAKEQGFDVESPVYHGTAGDIREFDLDRSGSMAGTVAERGIFTTPNQAEASQYAKTAGAIDTVDPANPMETDPTGFYGSWDFSGSNVMPLLARHGKTKTVDVKGYNSKQFAKHIASAKKGGYDTLVINGAKEHGRDAAQIISLNPANLRSVHAAFDPAKRDSADLLASVGGAGLVGAGLYGAYEDEQHGMGIGR
jgi:hypothetical protein